jgi:hypothetical protein
VPSVDVFRGFVMFLMLAEAMRLWTLHDAFPASGFWALVAFNTTHVPWQGCSLHDLIQPAFSFLAGASLPFSIASRRARGESFGKMLAHAVRRSLILILLGIFLRSMESPQTYWTFEDTLTQIDRLHAALPAGFKAARAGWERSSRSLDSGRPSRSTRCRPRASTTRASACRPAVAAPSTPLPRALPTRTRTFRGPSTPGFLDLSSPAPVPVLCVQRGGWSSFSFIPTLATDDAGRGGVNG